MTNKPSLQRILEGVLWTDGKDKHTQDEMRELHNTRTVYQRKYNKTNNTEKKLNLIKKFKLNENKTMY